MRNRGGGSVTQVVPQRVTQREKGVFGHFGPFSKLNASSFIYTVLGVDTVVFGCDTKRLCHMSQI